VKGPRKANTTGVNESKKPEESLPAGQQRVLKDSEVVQAECAAVAQGEVMVGSVDIRCGADQADIKAIVTRVVSEFDLPSVVKQLRQGAVGDDPLIQALAKALPLTHASILRLLAIVARTDVSPEGAAEELATLAQRHIRLVWRVGQLRSDSPVVGALRDQAAAAIAQGDYPGAEALLAKAEAELSVAQGTKPEAQAKRPRRRPPNDEFEALKPFTEVLSLLQTNHVDGIDLKGVVYGAIRGLLRVGDPIGAFLPPDLYREMQGNEAQETGGVGLELTVQGQQLIVMTPVDGTPAERAGLRPGDRILRIDNEPTPGIPLLDVVRKLRGPLGTPVILTIWRQEFTEPIDVPLMRERIAIANITFQDIGDGIAHVRMRHFNRGAAEEIQKTLVELDRQRTTALVLDLRNNPGGLLKEAVEVADLFLHQGQRVVETRGRVANQNMQFVAKGQNLWQHPVTVLVNEGSAGASEIVAGALQEWKRAVIVGVPTFGHGFIHTIIPLADGSGLKLTTARYFTPQGHAIQGKGIVPDIVVDQPKPIGDTNPTGELRQESIGSEGKRRVSPRADMQLDRALETLKARGL
jgi:carboxyl-terminal processing protease